MFPPLEIYLDDGQGQGVGAALLQAAVNLADKWLNLIWLELNVFVDNEPAIWKRFFKVLMKIG